MKRKLKGLKKKLPELLKIVKWLEELEDKKRPLRYWSQDETRLGLKTIERRKVTAYGVKPIGKVQWKFVAYYL